MESGSTGFSAIQPAVLGSSGSGPVYDYQYTRIGKPMDSYSDKDNVIGWVVDEINDFLEYAYARFSTSHSVTMNIRMTVV
jgi:hypothetical protein